MKFFFFSFYLTARRQNTITIMLIALIFQKESNSITSQLWLISLISRKIQNFSGHSGQRKSPLLLSFLYLHLPDISIQIKCTWYVHMYIHMYICTYILKFVFNRRNCDKSATVPSKRMFYGK